MINIESGEVLSSSFGDLVHAVEVYPAEYQLCIKAIDCDTLILENFHFKGGTCLQLDAVMHKGKSKRKYAVH
jgi:hypothetical protein